MKTIDQDKLELTPEEKRLARKRLFGMLFVLGVVILAGIGIMWVVERVQNRLYEIDVTQLESVTILDKLRGENIKINSQYWSKLVNNFESSFVTFNNTKWKALATLTLKFKNGETTVIDIYNTGQQPGCFRIGKVYYTGGDERKLSQIIDDSAKRQAKQQ